MQQSGRKGDPPMLECCLRVNFLHVDKDWRASSAFRR